MIYHYKIFRLINNSQESDYHHHFYLIYYLHTNYQLEFLYYYLGQAYEANNEVDKAISNYLKATAVNTKFALPYKKLGVLFLAR